MGSIKFKALSTGLISDESQSENPTVKPSRSIEKRAKFMEKRRSMRISPEFGFSGMSLGRRQPSHFILIPHPNPVGSERLCHTEQFSSKITDEGNKDEIHACREGGSFTIPRGLFAGSGVFGNLPQLKVPHQPGWKPMERIEKRGIQSAARLENSCWAFG